MEHSRLLKFFIPEHDICKIKMAESVKVNFDYQNPENVEAEVPGAQNIREGHQEDSSPQNDAKFQEQHQITEASSMEVQSEKTEGHVVMGHRQVSSSQSNGIQGEALMVETRSLEDKDKQGDKKNRTKIPVSRFRQTVEKVKAERKKSRTKKENESHIPVRRTSIPKPVKEPTNTKHSTGTVKKETTITRTEVKKEKSESTVKTVNNERTIGSEIKTRTEVRKETSVPTDKTVNNEGTIESESMRQTEVRKETSEPTVKTVNNERTIGSEIRTRTEVRKEISEPTLKTVTSEGTIESEIRTRTEIRKEISEPTDKTVTSEKTIELEITKTEKNDSIKTEDEFDKIYAEIVGTPTDNFDDSLLNTKEDPDKLESKFEEIIHNYDEHKVEPIDVDVVRRSKIPFLKRQSQQEVDLNAQADRTSKIIAARDKLRLRYSLNKTDEFEKELDKELSKANFDNGKDKSDDKDISTKDTKTEKVIKHEIISNPNSKTETEIEHEVTTSPNSKTEVKREFTKTVSTSSSNKNESFESSSAIETTTVKEVTTNESNDKKENKQQYITEENVIKDSIKIGIPIFESYIHEFSEKNETAKTIEVTSVLSYSSKSDDLSIKNNNTKIKKEAIESKVDLNNKISEFQASNYRTKETKDVIHELESFKVKETKRDASFVESIDQSERAINKLETKHDLDPIKANAEDEVQLRSKVGTLTSKIDSKELIETEINKRESINELMKKKSVLSKIAMFERKENDEPLKTVPRKEKKRPILIVQDTQIEHHVHVHTPLIVNEVYKPFQKDLDLNNEGNKEEITVKNDDKCTVATTESITVQSSDSVKYSIENKSKIENTFVEISNKNEKEVPALIQKINNEEVTLNHIEVDSEYTEAAKITEAIENEESTTSDGITSPSQESEKPPPYLRVYSNYGSQTNITEYQRTFPDVQRLQSHDGTKVGLAREIQAPVIIPGFKPVSEILRNFESKKDTHKNLPKTPSDKVGYTSTVTVTRINPTKTLTAVVTDVKQPEIVEIKESIDTNKETTFNEEVYDNFESVNSYKSLDEVFYKEYEFQKLKMRQEDEVKRAKSLAELDLGDAVKGKVTSMILRIKSIDRSEKKEVIDRKEMPRKRSVSEKIALFEGKMASSKTEVPLQLFKHGELTKRTEQNIERSRTEVKKFTSRIHVQRESTEVPRKEIVEETDEEVIQKIDDLRKAGERYGKVDHMPGIELANGVVMPVLAVGTALLDPRLVFHIVTAAIDLGYRAIDTAYIYGNEKQVGEAINAKIADGTVKRDELFIISKLWSTFHRMDLVENACRDSLYVMGLDYFDLYLIHNPMSFKEGGAPIPKIATVIQYSEYDFIDAWFGMEKLVTKGLARAIGVSNFNSHQLQRVLEKGRIKPVVNQVECHPYLTQQRLDLFCSERNVALSCFGVLGSKGTPADMKSGQVAAIDDPLVQVMAKGLNVTPGQLLISYQLEAGHGVVIKSSSAHHLWDNLRAIDLHLTMGQVDALHALNRNKRTFTFKGMGDTHKNYPFNIAF